MGASEKRGKLNARLSWNAREKLKKNASDLNKRSNVRPNLKKLSARLSWNAREKLKKNASDLKKRSNVRNKKNITSKLRKRISLRPRQIPGQQQQMRPLVLTLRQWSMKKML